MDEEPGGRKALADDGCGQRQYKDSTRIPILEFLHNFRPETPIYAAAEASAEREKRSKNFRIIIFEVASISR